MLAPRKLTLAEQARFAHLDWKDEMVSFLKEKALRHAVKVLGSDYAVTVKRVWVGARRVDIDVDGLTFRYKREKSADLLEVEANGNWSAVEDLVSLGRILAGPKSED